MSNIPEWLANLPWHTVVITIIVLLGLRFALLKQGTPFAKSVAEIAESLAIAMGLVFLIIRPFFVQSFFIPSESMFPTLRGDSQVHDHILVNKAVYRLRDPKRGDIVVFKAPLAALERSSPAGIAEPKQTDYIKRVIAVPGDRVYVEPGYVLVDGQPYTHRVVQSQIADKEGMSASPESVQLKLTKDGAYVFGRHISKEKLAEYLDIASPDPEIEIHPGRFVVNGKPLNEPYIAEDPEAAYPDLNNANYAPDLQKAIADKRLILIQEDGHTQVKLGKDQYLMIGDNRNHSSDSRFWGPLDRDRVVGRAMFIFWPLSRIRWVR